MIAVAQPGFAQDASSAGQGDTEPAEIIVTAQKRAERLSTTPLSMSAVTSESLARLNATQLRDFATTVPGLNFTTTGAGESQINMRGVTTGLNVTPTVAIYVDDVPYGSSSAFARSSGLALDVGLFDLDRIEVLRGPQGTLYGAGAMGGILKYVMQRPDSDTLTGRLDLGASDTRQGGLSYNGGGAINIPLAADAAAARVSGYYSRDGGYVDNVALGMKNVNRSEVYGGRADVLLTPTEQLSVRLTAFAQNIDRAGTSAVDKNLQTGAFIDGSLDQRRNVQEVFDQTFRLVSGTLGYDFGPVGLTSVSSYQHIHTNQIVDFSALYVPIFSGFGLDFSAVTVPRSIDTKKFTQEVRLASASNTSFEWLVGGFYTREKSQQFQDVKGFNPDGTPSAVNLLTLAFPSTYEEYAGFANATYYVTPRFDVGGGVRYAHISQKFQQVASGLLGGTLPRAGSTDKVFTYLGNARYRFSNRVMVYARVASGYRPGGPNAVANDPVTGQPLGPTTFDADKLTSYEVGIKASTADQAFSVDANLFNIDWNNLQIAAIRNGLGVLANASAARIKGAELTLTARPTRGLTVTGAFAMTDAKLSEDAIDLGGLKGDRLPDSPRFTAAIMGDYHFPIGGIAGSVGTTIRFVSDRVSSFDLSAGVPQYRLPDYTTVDLRAGVDLDPVRLQVFVRNLFDVRGELSASTGLSVAGGPAQVSILQPRTVGISASAKF